jgi:hypothetical protein
MIVPAPPVASVDGADGGAEQEIPVPEVEED